MALFSQLNRDIVSFIHNLFTRLSTELSTGGFQRHHTDFPGSTAGIAGHTVAKTNPSRRPAPHPSDAIGATAIATPSSTR